MKSLGLAGELAISRLLNKKNAYIKTIIFNWEEIVGRELSLSTFPIKVQNDEGKNVLHISVANSAFGTDLYYAKQLLLSRIATLLGKKIVDDIKIILKPAKHRDSLLADRI